jgi:hypothetical protein
MPIRHPGHPLRMKIANYAAEMPMPLRIICNLSADNVGQSQPIAIAQRLYTPMIVFNAVYPALDRGCAGLP